MVSCCVVVAWPGWGCGVRVGEDGEEGGGVLEGGYDG